MPLMHHLWCKSEADVFNWCVDQQFTYVPTKFRIYLTLLNLNQEDFKMATKREVRPSASRGNKKPKPDVFTKSKPVALTVKVDDKTYVRLSLVRATQRRTNQDILREALQDYLNRVEGRKAPGGSSTG